MALKDEKIITLKNIAALIPYLERNIPVMTIAEYETRKSSIPKNTFFVILDDGVSMSSVQEMNVTEEDLDVLIDDNNEIIDDPILDNFFND